MRRFVPLRHALPMIAVAVSTACASAPPAGAPANGPAAQQIIAVLQESAVAWNHGDLEGFLRPYLNGPQTTFVGQDVIHGYDAIREFYRGSWWRSGTPTVNLAYRDIDVRPLGPNHALVVGHWVVSNKETGQETRHGIFSLTFTRTPQGWRIIHDHSS